MVSETTTLTLMLTLMLMRFRNTNLLEELYVTRLYVHAHTQTDQSEYVRAGKAWE